jgi:uncharacterized protein YjbI with pentapeptide repeats
MSYIEKGFIGSFKFQRFDNKSQFISVENKPIPFENKHHVTLADESQAIEFALCRPGKSTPPPFSYRLIYIQAIMPNSDEILYMNSTFFIDGDDGSFHNLVCVDPTRNEKQVDMDIDRPTYLQMIFDGGATFFINTDYRFLTWDAPTGDTIAVQPIPSIPGITELKKSPHSNLDFSNINLEGQNFSGVHLINCKLGRTILNNVSFKGAVLDGCDFGENKNLSNINFEGAQLLNMNLSNLSFNNINFKGATLQNVILDNVQLKGADFTNANLGAAKISQIGVIPIISQSMTNRTKFNGATVNKKLMSRKNSKGQIIYDWSFADLTGVIFVDDEQKPTKDLTYLTAQSAFLKDLEWDYMNLSNADLSGEDTVLSNVNFAYATLSNGNLKNTNLSGCNFSHALMVETNLESANISNVDMPYAIFWSSSLSGATVKNVNFTGAFLIKADFSNIKDKNLQRCIFTNACLLQANFSGSNLSAFNGAIVSFDSACLQEVNFTGADVRGASFVNAAVSQTDNHTSDQLQIKGDIHDLPTMFQFRNTLLPALDKMNHHTRCPHAGTAGPCSGLMWNSKKAPMNTWVYGG